MPKPTSNVNEKNLILTRAKSAVIARDFTTAARLYKQLLQDDASNVEYLQELGSIYVKAGEDEKAIPYYEQIIAFYPHHIDSMTSLGAIYRRLKRYSESTAILERALDEGRQIPSINYNLGFTYREMGNYDDAIEAFNSVISVNPSDVLAYNHLGAIYFEKKDYQKSIASFKRGLQIDQNHPILNFNLARCYAAAKIYGDSIRCFENALKTKPGWVDCIQEFSTVLVQCQKTKQAADLVKNSILMHPNDVKLLCLLGNVYLNQFDYDSAVTTFKKATKINDRDIPSLSGLANALEKNEKPLEALDKISKAVEIAPDDQNVKKQFVHMLLSANEVEAAGVNVKELLNNGGDKDCEVYDLLSQYYICSDKPEQALDCYEKINKINHHYKKHLLNSAQRYQQKGNTEAAEHYAKQFVSRDIRNPAGYNMLGSIYSGRGDLENALEVYEKSRNLWQPNILADKKIENLSNQANTVFEPDEVLTPEEAEEQQFEIAEVQEEVLLEAKSDAEGEEFDFTQMGDNIPMAEALIEEEKSFFDELDEATGDAEEAIPDEEEPEKDDTHEIEIKTPDYSNLEDESLSPFDDANKALKKGEPRSDAENLMDMDFEEKEDQKPDFEPIPEPDSSDDDFDFGQFDSASGHEPMPEQASEQNTMPKTPSYDAPQGFDYPQPSVAQPPVAPESQDLYQQPPVQPPAQPAYQPSYSPEMQQKMQENTMDSANRAMETAFNAQRFAEELAVQQKMLEEKLRDVEANAVAAAKEAVQNQISQEVEEKVQAYAEEQKNIEEEINESSENLEYSESAEETELAEDFEATEEPEVTDESEFTEAPAEDIEEEFTEEQENSGADIETEYTENLSAESESVEENLAEEITTGSDAEAFDNFEESSKNVETSSENYAEITEEDAVGDEIEFATDSDVGDFTQDESVDNLFAEDSDFDFATTENLFEEEQTEPVADEYTEDSVVESDNDFTEETAFAAENEEVIEEDDEYEAQLASPQKLIPTIEKIISDNDIALENKAEIEMFKKLLSLCTSLPEPEKSDFMASQIRMKMEYLISKLSGQPGLLETADSLKKSGVLGEDEEEEGYGDFKPSNHQIRKVLKYMKKLTEDLEDKNLGQVLTASVDSILEKIEIAETDVQIFA